MSTSTKFNPAQAGLSPGLRLLVLEDDDFQRRMLAIQLRQLGVAEVREAFSGREALALLPEIGEVDIIITDLDMPGMDGMELIRRLGESACTASVIISSALDSPLVESVRTMTTSYGIDLLGVLEKPPERGEILRLIGAYEPGQNNNRPLASPAAEQYSLAELNTALEADQFEPFFQPKVALATGRLCGFEALARWRHPDRGMLSPHAFIDVMESGGLIDKLTEVMLDKASRECVAWHRAGLDIRVSVNLSPSSLADVNLASHLIKRVRLQGLEPGHIILEITETTVMEHVGAALENLARLRMHGFNLSIDDYGTGYSSLQQLNRIVASELKIDQSFVTQAAHQKSSRIMLQSSLELASKLKMTAIAEGVETRQDWQLLRTYGCDQAQGYFIGKPMAADAVADWVREWDTRCSDSDLL